MTTEEVTVLQRTLFDPDPFSTVDHDALTVRDGYLMAYRGNTRSGYATDLKLWFSWCADRGVGVLEAKRVDVETYMRAMEDAGSKASTRQRRLVAIVGYYRWAEQEEMIARSPATHVRKPRVSNVSTSSFLDRYELVSFLAAAEAIDPNHAALACLLALNGLRVSEAVGASIAGLAFANGHRTLSVVRKGGKETDVPLAPRTFRNVLRAVGDRNPEELVVLASTGLPMSRYNATRAVCRIARRAGITKRISPHSLRHSYVSLGLDAGVSLRDMQVGAAHADVSTTVRYDRRGVNLDRHASYIVAAYVGG